VTSCCHTEQIADCSIQWAHKTGTPLSILLSTGYIQSVQTIAVDDLKHFFTLTQSFCKYVEVTPWIHMAILKVTHCHTESQRRICRTGMLWSQCWVSDSCTDYFLVL